MSAHKLRSRLGRQSVHSFKNRRKERYDFDKEMLLLPCKAPPRHTALYPLLCSSWPITPGLSEGVRLACPPVTPGKRACHPGPSVIRPYSPPQGTWYHPPTHPPTHPTCSLSPQHLQRQGSGVRPMTMPDTRPTLRILLTCSPSEGLVSYLGQD